MISHQEVFILVDYNNLDELRSVIDNKFHYLYKIQNNINGKYYYGIHSTTNIFDGYKGSGKLLSSIYKQYGIGNCPKYILKFFDDRKSLLNYEKIIVNEQLVKDSNCYNLCIGGNGNFLEVNHEYIKHTTKNLIWINNGLKNKLIKSNELDTYIDNGWIKGELHSSTKGKIVITNDDEDKFIYESELESYIKQGWRKGGKSKNKGNKSFAKNLIWITNDIIQKRIYESELESYIKKGWRKGTCQKTTKDYIRITNGKDIKNIYNKNIEELQYYYNLGWKNGSKPRSIKYCWINNGENSKSVPISDVNSYIETGWKKGRILKKTVLPKRCAIYKDNTCKIIPIPELDRYIDTGWKKGNPKSGGNHTSGKIKIHNKIKGICINPEELEKYLSEGWILGSYKNKNF